VGNRDRLAARGSHVAHRPLRIRRRNGRRDRLRPWATPCRSPGFGDRHDGFCAGLKATDSICHPDGIRTTLDIDDELIATLLARLPGRSKTDAIEHAIEAFLTNDSVGRLKQLAGTMDIEDLSQELRRLDRTP
jgi:hypothetical protein